MLYFAAILAGENVLDSRLRGNDEVLCFRGNDEGFMPL
jgi:hypothetical protein